MKERVNARSVTERIIQAANVCRSAAATARDRVAAYDNCGAVDVGCSGRVGRHRARRAPAIRQLRSRGHPRKCQRTHANSWLLFVTPITFGSIASNACFVVESTAAVKVSRPIKERTTDCRACHMGESSDGGCATKFRTASATKRLGALPSVSAFALSIPASFGLHIVLILATLGEDS